MVRKFLVLLLLLAVPGWAQELNLIGPAAPLFPGASGVVRVIGMTEADVKSAVVEINPTETVVAYPAKLWSGDYILIFSASTPGKYDVAVHLNKWRSGLDNTIVRLGQEIDSAAKLGVVDPKIIEELNLHLKELKTTQDKLAKYPLKFGSCVVEVAGSVPPPPVDPNNPPVDPNKPPPIDPSTKIDRVTYVYEQTQTNVPRPVSAALQKLNIESGGSVVASIFEDDSVDAKSGVVPKQYAIALEESKKAGVPCLVVQAGDKVIRVLKAPTTTEQVLQAAKLAEAPK